MFAAVYAYLGRVWLALDRLANVVLFGQYETLSSRMGRAIKEDRCIFCKGICRLISFFWPDHCIHNIETVTSTKEIL
jgi:hypothetical protein